MSATKRGIPQDVALGDADAQAEAIALHRVDEAAAVTRPTHIGPLHVETEYSHLEVEQGDLWMAEGQAAARLATITAAGLTLSTREADAAVEAHAGLLALTLSIYMAVLEALGVYRRRPAKGKLWHQLSKAAFLLGDLAGIATAAIWMGEVPAIAVIMAISAATATVTAGISGAEVRDVRNRERRAHPSDELPESVRQFAHLFEAPDRGWRFVRALLYVSGSVAGIIACAIFGLRLSTEGPLVGLLYGGIAAAIAAASFIESYMWCDDIADTIDNAKADYERELARHQQLAADDTWKRHAEATAEATSLTGEHDHRGAAAQSHMGALRARVLRINPGIAGHGPALEPDSVGQTARRLGGAL